MFLFSPLIPTFFQISPFFRQLLDSDLAHFHTRDWHMDNDVEAAQIHIDRWLRDSLQRQFYYTENGRDLNNMDNSYKERN